MGDAQMGSQGRLMSQAMRKLNAAVARTKTCLIFINQLRFKVGVMFGNPETTSGGEALKFYTSMRITVRPSTAIKEGDTRVGSLTKIQVVKNKCAAPFKEAIVDQIFGHGFDPIVNNLETFVETGVVEKKGSAYFAFGECIGRGKDSAIATLQMDSDLYSKLYEKARRIVFEPPAKPAELAPQSLEEIEAASEAAEEKK